MEGETEKETAEEAQAKFEGPEMVGTKKATRPYVKKAGLAKAFTTTAKEQIEEYRDREVQLANFISQQSKLIETMQGTIGQLQKEMAGIRAASVEREMDAREAEMYDKTHVRRDGQQMYSTGPTVTPPSRWNIPSRAPIYRPEDEETPAAYTGVMPLKVRNPHRQNVRVNDLKTDKEDPGLIIAPFEVVDLSQTFSEDKVKNSKGLRFAMQHGMLVEAGPEDEVGVPNEPDSVQARLTKAIGRVPRRGKVTRNAKTGKIEREQGINDSELEQAAKQHVQQETGYDKALEEQREFESSGSNVV